MINTFRGKYNWLSNFYQCDIIYEGKHWKSSEHIYQAMKCVHEEDKEKIRKCSLREIKSEVLKYEQVDNWHDSLKDEIMEMALYLKFSQNPYLVKKLIDTGEDEIIEGNYWHDNYWGDCQCDNCHSILGLNKLGIMLMNIRKEIKNLL